MRCLLHTARRSDARAAFTLIEMLVVIVIMAVFASVAVPQYSRMLARANFDTAVQSILATLQTARDAAIRYGTDSVVTFDAQSQTLTVSVPSPALATDVPIVMQDEAASEPLPEPRVLNLGENITITNFESFDTSAPTSSNTPAAIQYHDDGSSTGGRLVIVSAEGYAAAVEVAPATGTARVTDEQ